MLKRFGGGVIIKAETKKHKKWLCISQDDGEIKILVSAIHTIRLAQTPKRECIKATVSIRYKHGQSEVFQFFDVPSAYQVYYAIDEALR